MSGTGTMRIMVVIGTRPEAIKMWPVIRALKEAPHCRVHVCLTAQHRGMLDLMVSELGIEADSDLNLMTEDQSLAGLSARLIPAFSELLQAHRPDMILVQGDTTSAALTAMTAFYDAIPVGHVEAGLRSGNRHRPFPEEINRRLTAVLAELHFAPTEQARSNLLAEGVDDSAIRVTGNPVIDAVRLVAGRVEQASRPRVLMTAHRRENFGEPLRQIFMGIREVATAHPEIDIVYPVHPNPAVHDPAHRMLGGIANVRLLPPMGYRAFVEQMQQAWVIVSDSGGVQEEATALGRPVLLLRSETERPEAIGAGNVRQAPLTMEALSAAVVEMIGDRALRERMMKVSDAFGDGHAAERIAAEALRFLTERQRRA